MNRKELVAYRQMLYTELKNAEKAFDKSSSVKNQRAVTAARRAYEKARECEAERDFEGQS